MFVLSYVLFLNIFFPRCTYVMYTLQVAYPDYFSLQVKHSASLVRRSAAGEVLRVQDKYFHIGCFKCAQCNASLAQGGFFAREGSYYCTKVLENKKIRNQSYVKSLIKTEKTSIMRSV